MLYKGKLFFNDEKIETTLKELNEDIEVEHLVVGGGITGILLCEKLLKENKNVTLIEKEDIASGSTSANTGLLQWMSDKTLTKMLNEGTPGLELYKKCLLSIDYIEKLITEYDIKCDFKRISSVYHPSNKDDIEILKEEFALLQDNDFPVEFRNNTLISKNDGTMNCYLFTKLLFLSLSKKLTTYKATAYNQKENTIYTKNNKITFKKIYYTTGYDNLKIRGNKDCILEKTHVVVTKPLKKNIQCMHWETKRPYLYIKPIKDRILIGGLDKKEDSLDDYTNKTKILLEKAMLLLDRFDLEDEYSYSAYFGSTHSGFPHLVNEGNAYYIYNMGGNGVLYSVYLINKLK